jgi:hypothetical protein
MKRGLLSALIVTVLFAGTVSLAAAQADIPRETFEDAISLRVLPQIPQPGQYISVEVKSLSLNLDRATISWYTNGIKTQSAIGLKKINTQALSAGSSMVIRVVVTLDGRSYEQTTTIITGSVDLIWQAKSYTPPFYRGKALFPYQADITVAAFANLIENGVRLNPKDLIYSWKANGDVLKDSSGYGKDSVTIRGGVILRPIEVSVSVSSVSGKTVATAETSLTYTNPQVIFYENNPLYGALYHQALEASINLKSQEIWLKAAPYFMSTSQLHKDADLSYEWSINNSQTTQRANTIILRNTSKEAGSSAIGTKISNTTKILQGAQGQVTINFNTP